MDRIYRGKFLYRDGQHELEFYKLGIGGMVERVGGKQSTASSQLREIKPDQFEDLRKQWKGSTEIHSADHYAKKRERFIIFGVPRHSSIDP
jgi:hypothetical protein